jgi:hypothetical protein
MAERCQFRLRKAGIRIITTVGLGGRSQQGEDVLESVAVNESRKRPKEQRKAPRSSTIGS